MHTRSALQQSSICDLEERGAKTVAEGGVMLAVRAEIAVCAIAGSRD